MNRIPLSFPPLTADTLSAALRRLPPGDFCIIVPSSGKEYAEQLITQRQREIDRYRWEARFFSPEQLALMYPFDYHGHVSIDEEMTDWPQWAIWTGTTPPYPHVCQCDMTGFVFEEGEPSFLFEARAQWNGQRLTARREVSRIFSENYRGLWDEARCEMPAILQRDIEKRINGPAMIRRCAERTFRNYDAFLERCKATLPLPRA